MIPIPGDEGYGKEVVASQLDALASRINDVNKLLDPLLGNVRAIGNVVTALALDTDEDVTVGLDKVASVVSEMLDKSSTALEELIERSGVMQPKDAEAAEPEPTPAAFRPAPRRGPKIPTKTPDRAAEPPDGQTTLLPPSLRALSNSKEVQVLLGTRVYGIGINELENLTEVIKDAETFIKVSADGKSLRIVHGKGVDYVTDNLPATVVRGINIYCRAIATGITEFKRSDITALLQSPSSGVNMGDVTSKTNSTLKFELHIPDLFIKTGKQKAGTRYIPSGKVIFIADEVSIVDIVGNAP